MSHEESETYKQNAVPQILTLVTTKETLSLAAGLAKLLSSECDFPVVQFPSFDLDGLIAGCRQVSPSVLVVHERAARKVNSIKELSRNGTCLLAIAESNEMQNCRDLVQLGCAGVIIHDASAELFYSALRAIQNREIWAPRRVLSDLLRESAPAASPLPQLTAREKQILDAVANGHANREIASQLSITRETVRWHIRTLYSKLGVTDRQAAIRYATTSGFHKNNQTTAQ